jgi:hypothetical protein
MRNLARAGSAAHLTNPASLDGATAPSSGGARLRRRFKEPEQFADGVVAMRSVAERQLFVYVVAVAASVADLREVAGLDEIVDDPRGRSLGYADDAGDISEAARTVA